MKGADALRRDREAFAHWVVGHEDALFLVGLEEEMRGGREDAGNRRQFLRDKGSHFAQGFAFDDDQQVVAAGHQIAGFDLVVFGDAARESIKAALALRRDFHFDHRAHEFDAELLFVDDRAVAEDDLLVLVAADPRGDFRLWEIEQNRKLRGLA